MRQSTRARVECSTRSGATKISGQERELLIRPQHTTESGGRLRAGQLPLARASRVDIPIGLNEEYEAGGRFCDREARKCLRGRASSVFPAPGDGLDEATRSRPLLRFLMLVTAGSAEGSWFPLRRRLRARAMPAGVDRLPAWFASVLPFLAPARMAPARGCVSAGGTSPTAAPDRRR